MWILRLSWHANGDGGGIFINGHIHILRDLHLELNGAKHDLVSKEGEEEVERREDQSKEMTDWLWPNGDQASDKKRSNVNHVTNMANRNHGATKSFCTDCQLIAPFRPSHPLPTSWAAVRAVLLFGSNSCLVIGSKASLPPQSIHTVHRVSQSVSVSIEKRHEEQEEEEFVVVVTCSDLNKLASLCQTQYPQCSREEAGRQCELVSPGCHCYAT